MSGTIPTPPAAIPAESLWTPQVVITLFGLVIVAGTIGAVFWQGDPQTKSQTVGGVLMFLGAIGGFWFGSSKGSQVKDQVAAARAGVTVVPAAPGVKG